jgi:hypothetical protein
VREADRQAGRRIDLAEQHVGHRVTGLGAQEPGGQHGRGGLDRALQHQGPAVAQQHHRRLAHRPDQLGQLLLHARQADLGARLGLARHVLALADRQQHHVGGRAAATAWS